MLNRFYHSFHHYFIYIIMAHFSFQDIFTSIGFFYPVFKSHKFPIGFCLYLRKEKIHYAISFGSKVLYLHLSTVAEGVGIKYAVWRIVFKYLIFLSGVSRLLAQYVYPYTVSGQNKIGREFTLLPLIQPTIIKQQTVNNNWL